MKKLIIALSICLVLLLGVCVALHLGGNDGTSNILPTETVKTWTVRFEMGGVLCSEQTVEDGALPESVSAQVPGLSFREWVDEQGNAVDPFAQAVTGDICYQALYYPELSGQVPYLFANEEGLLRPDEELTCQELWEALTALAAEGAADHFPELPDGEAISYGELAAVLEAFYESDAVTQAFAHAGEGGLTRSDFARGMNALLRRQEGDAVTLAADAVIPVDVTADRTDAAQLLMASVPYTADGSMTWAEAELPTTYEPGFVHIDGWLYYVQEDHYFLRNGHVGTLYFGADGRHTSGDEALDGYVSAILKDLIAEAPEADRLTLLRDAYDHCHTQYTYRRTYDHPAFGETGWEIQRAVAMFESGKGNCYSFAAIFWALARGLGYEARAISGTCLSDEQPHSWCIIELDGEDYFFDPEWQYAYTERGVFDKDMFMIPMDKVSYWTYKWTEEGKEAAD